MICRYKKTLAKKLKKMPKTINRMVERGEIKEFIIDDFKGKKPPISIWVYMPGMAVDVLQFLESWNELNKK